MHNNNPPALAGGLLLCGTKKFTTILKNGIAIIRDIEYNISIKLQVNGNENISIEKATLQMICIKGRAYFGLLRR